MSRVIVEDGPLAAMLDSLQAFARRLMDKELSVDLGVRREGALALVGPREPSDEAWAAACEHALGG